MRDDLAFALGAGTLAALNPCGFAMLPAYLALFVTGEEKQPSRLAALSRALLATAAMTAGFLAVFVTFGLALTPIASTVQRWLPVVSVGIGVVLVILGLAMLAGRNVLLRTPKLKTGKPRRQPAGDGALRHLLRHRLPRLHHRAIPGRHHHHLPRRGHRHRHRLLRRLRRRDGMVVGVLAVAAAMAQQSAARFLRRAQAYVTRISAAFLVIAGAYVTWYGIYELRIYAGSSSSDPIVDGATDIQNTLAGWVDDAGPWPFAFALAILVAIPVAMNLRKVRRRSAGSATPGTDPLLPRT